MAQSPWNAERHEEVSREIGADALKNDSRISARRHSNVAAKTLTDGLIPHARRIWGASNVLPGNGRRMRVAWALLAATIRNVT